MRGEVKRGFGSAQRGAGDIDYGDRGPRGPSASSRGQPVQRLLPHPGRQGSRDLSQTAAPELRRLRREALFFARLRPHRRIDRRGPDGPFHLRGHLGRRPGGKGGRYRGAAHRQHQRFPVPYRQGAGARGGAAARAREGGLPIVYLNLVRGQDELVFDVGSVVMDSIDIAKDTLDIDFQPHGHTVELPHDEQGISEATRRLREAAPRLVVLQATGGLETELAASLMAAALAVTMRKPRGSWPRQRTRLLTHLALPAQAPPRLPARSFDRFQMASDPSPRPPPTRFHSPTRQPPLAGTPERPKRSWIRAPGTSDRGSARILDRRIVSLTTPRSIGTLPLPEKSFEIPIYGDTDDDDPA